MLWYEGEKQIYVIKAGLLGFYTVQYIGFLLMFQNVLSPPSWYVYSIGFTCVLRWIGGDSVSITDQRCPLHKQIMIPQWPGHYLVIDSYERRKSGQKLHPISIKGFLPPPFFFVKAEKSSSCPSMLTVFYRNCNIFIHSTIHIEGTHSFKSATNYYSKLHCTAVSWTFVY